MQNNYVSEILNILQDITNKTNSNFELHNIKLTVPDTVLNENGKVIKRSENYFQITYHDFVTTKMSHIAIYLSLMLMEMTEDCRKTSNYTTRIYRKYDLMHSNIRENK